MQTFLLILTLLSLIIPLCSIPTPLLHPSHFLNHSPRLIKTNTSHPQQYLEVTRPLPLTPSTHHARFQSSLTISATLMVSPCLGTLLSPLNCTWSNVVLDIRVSCQGEQYDRIAAVWLSGAELIRTSTAEPTDDGVFWSVRKDVTRYSSLLARDNLTLSFMLENIVNHIFTGVYQVNVTFHYYDTASAPVPVSDRPLIALPGENEIYYNTSRKLKSVDNPLNLKVNYEQDSFDVYERPADLIIPISSVGDDGFWFRIQKESDIHSKMVGIPRNTYRAVIEIYSSSHGDDEFWYSNPPDAYLLNMEHNEAGQTNPPDSSAEMKKVKSKRGHGAYREVLVKIDENLVGSVVPFPVIFTGGINPLFWDPVVGIGAFDLPSYDLELTPFLELLLDGKLHSYSFEVADAISFWLVDANLHLWLDAGSLEVQAGIDSSKPEFSLERESKFDGLDGKFEIETERKTKISGWVNTSAGNLSTSYEQNLKFENTIKFSNNGTSKSVEQKVKDKSEMTIKSGNGTMIYHIITKREYPLKVSTETLPGKENDTYVMTTSLETSIEEKKTIGHSSSTLKNKQGSSGWMSVKDHEVLSGAANTQQSYNFKDGSYCYSRIVAAENGTLLSDSTNLLCVNSL